MEQRKQGIEKIYEIAKVNYKRAKELLEYFNSIYGTSYRFINGKIIEMGTMKEVLQLMK